LLRVPCQHSLGFHHSSLCCHLHLIFSLIPLSYTLPVDVFSLDHSLSLQVYAITLRVLAAFYSVTSLSTLTMKILVFSIIRLAIIFSIAPNIVDAAGNSKSLITTGLAVFSGIGQLSGIPKPIITASLALLSSIGQLNDTGISQCSLQNAVPPLNSSNPNLPPPSPGLSLKYVALGQGTQNYTCLADKASLTPIALGAVATLFDASCLAENCPVLLDSILPVAEHVPLDVTESAARILGQISNKSLVLGRHYFVDTTTPLFDFTQFGHPEWMEGIREASTPAPICATVPSSASVPWLKLKSKAGVGIEVSRISCYFDI
jgi:Protein of unknown function (DUF3455)